MIAATPVQVFDNVGEDPVDEAGCARRAQTASVETLRSIVAALRHAIDTDDGQVLPACLELDIEFDGHARLASDQGPGLTPTT